ncbi:MAG: MgtC/SapB family protein [Chloracidobacterium sp.]|nr:MgtC/SapB family protein [Chloracidobacterium sp.]MDW8216300.1 MgtC/SapB family protein [Acidobacteriota bacterium]
MTWLTFAEQLMLAALCGAVVGLERQWRQRQAGLRTNALVAIGAAAYVALPTLVDKTDTSPTRVAAQVVSGIGFLAGGVILKEGASVRGLNTAATLWCSSAIGVLAGSSLPLEALLLTAFVLAAHLALRPLARRINRQPLDQTDLETAYRLEVTCGQADEAHIRPLLIQEIARSRFKLQSLRSVDLLGSDKLRLEATVSGDGQATDETRRLEDITARLAIEAAVTAIGWEMLVDDESPTLESRRVGSDEG